MGSLPAVLVAEPKIMAVSLLLQIIHMIRILLNRKRKFMELEHFCSLTGI